MEELGESGNAITLPAVTLGVWLRRRAMSLVGDGGYMGGTYKWGIYEIYEYMYRR